MSEDRVIVNQVDSKTVSETFYDVVIVGAGIAGSIVAKELSNQGKQVLIIEAGTAEGLTLQGFQSYVENFYSAVEKNPNSPYPLNPNAFSPTDGDHNYFGDHGYFVEKGPRHLSGSYTRVTGGTTMHWEGKTLRMLPDDFKLRTKYGKGLDWPIRYEELWPYYRKAEYEIGVSGNAEEQRKLGITFEDDGYVFPMEELPPSYLDQKVGEKINGTTVELGDENVELRLSTFPQGRNSRPNPKYKQYNNGHGFIPDHLTSEHPVEYGERCQGNANCAPLCPVQAKYDARRTLGKIAFPERVHFLPQTVASQVEIDSETGCVTAIHYKQYKDKNSPKHILGMAKGRLFVLAANAVENARLMLSSGLLSTSGLMGCNLMDHPFLLAWALMPEVTGTMRGPIVTSGISAFRNGLFRKQQASFGVDIHNDGWGWSGTGAIDVAREVVEKQGKYGTELRKELIEKISKQLLLAIMCELPADPSNRVTIDPQYKDQLGNFRPVIHFDIPDYCKETMAYARRLSQKIFARLGAKDYTHYDKSDPAFFEYKGEGYWCRGGNHFSGTHVMGTNKYNSVVDSRLRSWDHNNLYLLGSGSMPTIGSSNTSLTIAALSFRASEQMLQDLKP